MKAYQLRGLIAGLAVGLTVGAVAEESTNTTALAEESVRVIPQDMASVRTVSVIEGEHLQNIQAVTLGDVFRVDPEITVGGGGIPAAQKIYVRGLEDTLLNVQIDGAQQTAQPYHHQGRILIAPELIKRVEVESGAGAATQGPGALGGAIRVETKSASDMLAPGQKLGAIGKAGYLSNGEAYDVLAGVYGSVHESFNLLATYNRYESDNYEAGGGIEVPDTQVTRDSAMLKADGESGAFWYTASYDLYMDTGPRRIRPNFMGDITHPVLPNPVVDTDLTRHTGVINTGVRPIDNDWVDFKVTLYANHQESTQKSDGPYVSGPPFSYNAVFDYDLRGQNFGGDIRNTSEFELAGDHGLTYGLDFRQDKATFENRSTGGNALPPPAWFSNWPSGEEEGSVAGAYIQDNWRWSPRFLVSFGTRWDTYHYEDRAGVQNDSSGFSPNIGATFSPTEYVDIYANAAKAIRGMTVGEALWIGDGRKVTDPNASAERAYNGELGLNVAQSNWRLNAEVFNAKIKDYIGYLNRTNLGEVNIPGYSASFGYNWDMLVASIGVNYTKPTLNGETLVNEENIALGTASGRTWIASLEYLFASQNVRLGWNARFTERLDDLPDDGTFTRPDKPGFGVHDLYVNWNPPQRDNLTLALTIKNVFDNYYYEHSTYGFNSALNATAGLPEPGRDFRISATYQF